MDFRAILLSAALAFAASAARAETPPAPPDCTAQNGLTPFCGIHQPEDITPLPDGKAMLVSEMNLAIDNQMHMTWGPGRLSVLDLATGRLRALYPTETGRAGHADWGDPACKSVGAAFSPHGINLSRRADGKWQLLAVNHGQQNSIEFFEVKGKGADLHLDWRGCVRVPDATSLNDVAALPAGGFVTTVMAFGEGENMIATALKAAEQGLNTGFVLRWRPGIGQDLLPSSIMPMPNGIEVSPDGKSVFVASFRTEGEVRKIDLATGAVVGAVKISKPDNLSWGTSGRLTVATGPVPDVTCKKGEPCPTRFDIIAINPAGMTRETIFSRADLPLDNVSVAVELGNAFYVAGPFGDRVLKFPRGQ